MLAEDLVDKYDLHHKRIVEIGCGKGEFLKLICDLGQNTGIGFDPAYVPGRLSSDGDDRLTFIKDYYSEKYADYSGDLICCRMTLEHIPDPAVLIKAARHALDDRSESVVFLQVPDITRILSECAFEDIYYEHCSYFSPGSIARLVRRCGLDILDIQRVFDNQYITLEAAAVEHSSGKKLSLEDDLEMLRLKVEEFKKNVVKVIQYWNDRLYEFKQAEKKVIIWGSGSKGVSFLNTIKNSSVISYVTDINPHRQGTFMAGTGQAIVSPSFLKDYGPDAVLIMNNIYRKEIVNELGSMGLDPEVVALGDEKIQ
jgi:SAM-dependent methyltransferase